MAKATPLRVNLQAEDDGETVVVEVFEFIDPLWGFGVVELNDRLKQFGPGVKTIKVRIHSRGGNAMEGFAIFSILLGHPAEVVVEIIGVAASAASTVAMAASPGKIFISPVGFVMIHDPWAFADGNAIVMRRVAEMLDRVQPAIVRAYLRHAKLSTDEISAAMSVGEGAGTWFDADAAIEAGLASEVMAEQPVAQNRITFDELKGVPQAALELFAAPAPGLPSDDDLFLAVLDDLRTAPQPQFNQPAGDDRLAALLEEALS